MKILLIGASGTIGKAVTSTLGDRYEIYPASRNSEISVDLSERDSIASMFRSLPRLDAVVSVSGNAKFGPLDELSDEDFALGLGDKLMGQINLVRLGREHVKPGGSFTLTSGILAHQPHAASVMLTMINAGLEGFVRSAAMGMADQQRLNIVSPPMVMETARAMGWGQGGMRAAEVANYYVRSIESAANGQVIGPLH